MVSSSPTRSKVFISYSHKDARYLKQLQTHLAYYERVGLIEVWDDTKLSPGAVWHEEIKDALRATKVAILLVSAAFLASKFIVENELPPLLAAAQSEGAIIVPVILSACAFEDTELAQFQAVNSPSKPLLSMSKSDKEKIWYLVARTVIEAINSQPSVEEMYKQSVEEKKVTQELPAANEMQLQQVVGILDFREAINAHDWQRAEKILQKYPNLPDARSLLGLSISREVQEYFFNQLHPSLSLQLGPVTPLYYTQFAQTQPAPPKLEAIHWLKEALQHNDNPEGNVTGALALMYGYSEAYDKMIDSLQKALTINPSLTSYFQHPDNLMMLIYACHNLASVEEVMHNVSLKLPELDDVQQAIKQALDSTSNGYIRVSPIKWYAIEIKMGNISRMPVKVLLEIPDKNGLTYAQVSKEGQLTITIPPQASMIIDPETLIPVDEILKRLTDIGIVLITLI